jgi:nickel-dependent lactate racemase
VEIEIPYSGNYIRVDLPLPKKQVRILESKDPSVTEDLEAIVEDALRNPIGKDRLAKMVRKGYRVALMFDDWTRPTPISRIMPMILKELKKGGVRDEDIVLICGNGMHDPAHMNQERLIEKLGKDIFRKYRVISHDAYDCGNLTYVGETKCLRTPLFVNKHVTEADIRISIGRIAPHGDVGYSGGSKMIMPGVSDIWSIIHHHSRSYSRRGVLMNPLRTDIDECGRMARLDFIINVVSNSKEEVVGAFAGDPIFSHRKGVQYGNKEVWGSKVKRKAEIVIVSPGLNKDDYFIPSMRCLGVALRCLKKGGTIIMVSSCQRGWSERSYLELGWHPTKDLLEYDYPDLLHLVMSRAWHEPNRQFQALVYYVHHIVRTCFKNHVILAGSKGFTKEEAKRINIQFEESLGEAIRSLMKKYGEKARAIVIPDAFILPVTNFQGA